MADHTDLIQRLRDEGDLCANEIGSGGIATLLWEAAKALDVPPCSACDERAKAAAENAQWHADVAAGRKIVRDYVIEHMQPLYQVFNSPLAKSTCHKRRNDYCQCERKAALCDGAGPAVMSKSAPETNTSVCCNWRVAGAANATAPTKHAIRSKPTRSKIQRWRASVLECGSPLPLWVERLKSGRLPHSGTPRPTGSRLRNHHP